jgi:predicted membrane channel-forming protein YqfA (hemolysin III family)
MYGPGGWGSTKDPEKESSMIKIRTYNQALLWSRIERMAVIMIIMSAITTVLQQVSMTPLSIVILGITAFIAQLAILKCWLDLANKGRPDKNCWEFERE